MTGFFSKLYKYIDVIKYENNKGIVFTYHKLNRKFLYFVNEEDYKTIINSNNLREIFVIASRYDCDDF